MASLNLCSYYRCSTSTCTWRPSICVLITGVRHLPVHGAPHIVVILSQVSHIYLYMASLNLCSYYRCSTSTCTWCPSRCCVLITGVRHLHVHGAHHIVVILSQVFHIYLYIWRPSICVLIPGAPHLPVHSVPHVVVFLLQVFHMYLYMVSLTLWCSYYRCSTFTCTWCPSRCGVLITGVPHLPVHGVPHVVVFLLQVFHIYLYMVSLTFLIYTHISIMYFKRQLRSCDVKLRAQYKKGGEDYEMTEPDVPYDQRSTPPVDGRASSARSRNTDTDAEVGSSTETLLSS